MDFNIPSDNMYKYLAILSTIIFIVCLIVDPLLVNIGVQATREEYREMLEWLTRVGERDLFSHFDDTSKASISELFKLKAKTWNRISRYIPLLYLKISCIQVVSAIIAIKAYSRWWKREQSLKDILLRTEVRKKNNKMCS